MAEKRYTITELADLWNEYEKAFATRYLICGKWGWLNPQMDGVVATRAERVKIMDHKTFIEFLKEKADG